MADQYAVVFFPYSHITPEAVGPFRSLDRAEAAAERLDAAGDHSERSHAPSVVRLMSTDEAVAWLDGDPTEGNRP